MILWIKRFGILCGMMATSLSADRIKSIPTMWEYDDGPSGWGEATPLDMGIDVKALYGYLQGNLLLSGNVNGAFIDSPPLYTIIEADERDYLVFRLRYHGQCDTGMISIDRDAPDEMTTVFRQHELHNPVEIPFQVQNALDFVIYYIPLWKHVTGMIRRVRFHPCTLPAPPTSRESGHGFQLDWVAFAKAPLVTQVRGCIDEFYEHDLVGGPKVNCSEMRHYTNGIHESITRSCTPMSLPIVSTYNCARSGGERITIRGKHFGTSNALVTIDGVRCIDIVHTIPETELQCTLPPVQPEWMQKPFYPSNVQVRNGRLPGLQESSSMLAFASPVHLMDKPVISNQAAHAVDVNWKAPMSVRESLTVTGYLIEWKQCEETLFLDDNNIVVGNVTSTSIIGLDLSTDYEFQVSALTEDQRLGEKLQDIDLYGRRTMDPNAIVGSSSPLSDCISTFQQDISFVTFSAGQATNLSALSPPTFEPTRGPTGEIGDQGHFGLTINGDAQIENCNITVSCCDGYNVDNEGAHVDSCEYICGEVETRASTYINSYTTRSVRSNSDSALPSPSKKMVPASVYDGSLHENIAPITSSCGPSLRLTSSHPFQTGSAWYPRSMNVREGFDTTFTFRIANPSTNCKRMDDTYTRCRSRGGDGFAFVIQNDGAMAVGNGGMELGYGGLRNGIAMEFDTWYNFEQSDAFENHISVHIGDKIMPVRANHTQSLGSTVSIPDLTTDLHAVRIVYDPNVDEQKLFSPSFVASTVAGDFFANGAWDSGIGIVSIYLDDMNKPVLMVPLRIEETIELNHGRAWVGFSASTGETAWQTQDILSWSFRSLRRELAKTPVP